MSMTADDSYDSCGPWDMFDLKDLLLGSKKMWRSTCKKTVPHVLIIEPNVECRGEEWMVQYLTFRLTGARKVEVYVDDEKVYSVCCSIFITVRNDRNAFSDIMSIRSTQKKSFCFTKLN